MLSGGLFCERTTRDWCPLISWQPTCDDDNLFFTLASLTIEGSAIDDCFQKHIAKNTFSLNKCALSSRAWVIQEMVLSPRMLTFTNKQLIWQCAKTAACEEFPAQTSGLMETVQYLSPFWAATSRHHSLISNKQRSHAELRSLRERWFQILHMYALTKLSYPERDLVKAVDGIGQYFAQLTGRIYRHGILEGTLPQALSWKTIDDPEHQHGSIETAPNWHWASQNSFSYATVLPEDGDGGWDHANNRSRHIPAKALAHAFLLENNSPLDSDAATDATLSLQWPVLICIGRLLRIISARIRSTGDEASSMSATLDLGSRHRINSSSGYIDARQHDDFKKLRPDGLRFLPLGARTSLSGLLIYTDEYGNCKRVGFLNFFYTKANGPMIIQKLLQTKPRLIVIE